MLSSLNLKAIKWVIIGDGMLWNPRDRFILPHDAYSTADFIFLCDEKQTSSPVQAIPLSAYDGFAIKNILAHVLNIPSAVILRSSDFSEIIQRRCRDLEIPFCFISISNKPPFIVQFCEDHSCTLQDILIFDNDLTLSDFHGKQPRFLISNPPITSHFIRFFVDAHGNSSDKVLSYYNETRINKMDGLKNIRSEAKKIRALICDIDGTCTDGFKIYGEDGSQWKRFSLKDIQALKTWNESGNLSFFITGESAPIPLKLAEQCHMPMDHVFMNAGNGKAQILCEICQKYTLTLGEIAYIGDAMNDLGIIELLIQENGTAACPANAMCSIQKIPSIHHLKATGGYGAIAEFIQMITSQIHS